MTTLTTGTSFSNDAANGYIVADGFSGPSGNAATFPNGISGSTPISGAVTATTLTVTTSAVISPSGTVAISPTGALTVNPTAASTINNTSIGVTTPAAGKFTTSVATSYNGNTLTTGTGTVTLGANTLTLAGNFTTTGAFNTTFAQTASATYTLSGIAGTVASTSGANLAIIDARRCTSAQTANTNVVPANITGLSGAVAIGTYTFRASIYCTIASGTGGVAVNQVLTTAVLSACNFQAKGYTASAVAVQATTTATSGTVLFTQAAVVLQIDIEGSFTVSTAGTFALQMCQNTSDASNSVVNVGSTMTLTRIA